MRRAPVPDQYRLDPRYTRYHTIANFAAVVAQRLEEQNNRSVSSHGGEAAITDDDACTDPSHAFLPRHAPMNVMLDWGMRAALVAQSASGIPSSHELAGLFINARKEIGDMGASPAVHSA